MKLYYAPGACSLSVHIVAEELGLPIEYVRIEGKTHKTQDGADYYAINPRGQVPALQFDDGAILTEVPVLVQYLADQKPEAKLAPPAGTMPRYRLMEWLNFVATELHKTMSPLFNPKLPEELRQSTKERLFARFDHLEKTLSKQAYLMGDAFTVADAYLFTVTNWLGRFEVSLDRWPNYKAFMERMKARPGVQAAMKAEGLLK